jgi:putative intracellular protease/amidase
MTNTIKRLTDKVVGIFAVDGTHEHEFWVPYYRFKEEGATVQVIVCVR